jgi:hypothetical protein
LYYGDTDGYHSFIDDHVVEGGSPPSQRMFGDPGPGNIYYGESNLPGPGGVSGTGREAFYGRRCGVSRTYWNWSTANNAVSQAAGDIAQGRLPWMSFKLTNSPDTSQNQTWAQFAASPNPWFQAMIDDLGAIGAGPIVVTLHHEPNGDGQTAANHKAMYQTAHAITDNYPQILLVPCLSAGYYQISQPAGPHYVISDWFDPNYNDGFGLDMYNPWSVGDPESEWRSIDQAFRQGGMAQCTALDPNTPIMIGEFGVHTYPATVGRAAQWMQDAYDYCRNAGVTVMSYFDSGVGAVGGPWILDQSSTGSLEGTPERLNKQKVLINASTSKSIGLGGIAA